MTVLTYSAGYKLNAAGTGNIAALKAGTWTNPTASVGAGVASTDAVSTAGGALGGGGGMAEDTSVMVMVVVAAMIIGNGF